MKFLIGFRKFVIMGIFMAISLALLLFGYMDGKTWADVTRDAVVAFMGTNIGEHLLNAAKDWIESKKIDSVNRMLGNEPGKK